MSYLQALNASAPPYVPVKKCQFGSIGEEKKKIQELEEKNEKLTKELSVLSSLLDNMCKSLEINENKNKILMDNNKSLESMIVTMKISVEAFTLANEELTREKEELIKKTNHQMNTISNLWCQQTIMAMLKNKCFMIYHSELMLMRNELVNNNNAVLQKIIKRTFELITLIMPFSPPFSPVFQ